MLGRGGGATGRGAGPLGRCRTAVRQQALPDPWAASVRQSRGTRGGAGPGRPPGGEKLVRRGGAPDRCRHGCSRVSGPDAPERGSGCCRYAALCGVGAPLGTPPSWLSMRLPRTSRGSQSLTNLPYGLMIRACSEPKSTSTAISPSIPVTRPRPCSSCVTRSPSANCLGGRVAGGLKGLDGRWRRAAAGFVITSSMRLVSEPAPHAPANATKPRSPGATTAHPVSPSPAPRSRGCTTGSAGLGRFTRRPGAVSGPCEVDRR